MPKPTPSCRSTMLVWTTSAPCLCVCVFLNTSSWVSLPWSTWTPHTTAFGAGAQCAILDLRPQARRLAAGSFFVCGIEFVFPRRRLTHLCRKPRVPRWRLHICVRSRASGQNSSCYRSLRPNWLFNSPSSSTSQTRQSRCRLSGDVQPPSWPVTTPPANGVRHGCPPPLTRDCRRPVNELE